MSVYINGMEIEENCVNCPARHGAECWASHCARIPDYHKSRPSWCPLIPIPDHGRLGDLDKLIARYEKQKAEAAEILCDERAFSADYERARYMYARAVEFISALKSQAAVIPADYADKGGVEDAER